MFADSELSIKEIEILAEQGDAGAQFYLGWMYFHGTGVTQDFNEAARLYKLAAEQGIADAQYWIGVMYSNGLGETITLDYKKAIKWWTLADGEKYVGEFRDGKRIDK